MDTNPLIALAKVRAAAAAGSNNPQVSVPENGMLPPRGGRKGFRLGQRLEKRRGKLDRGGSGSDRRREVTTQATNPYAGPAMQRALEQVRRNIAPGA